MKKYILLTMFIGIFLANSVVLTNGENICENFRHGVCLYDHELQGNRCPDGYFERITGERAERECEEFGDEAPGRDEDEGVNCCLRSPEGDEGDGDDEVRETLLLSVRNVGVVTVNSIEEEPCCKEEGFVPEEGEVCCDGMPRERGYGACGCPNNFRWDPLANQGQGRCLPIFARCGYVQERNVCTSLGYILVHPLECLLPSRENPPYEQTCCLYTLYEGEEYYQFENVEVY